MGRQQAAELRRGGVEMLCDLPAQSTSTVSVQKFDPEHVYALCSIRVPPGLICLCLTSKRACLCDQPYSGVPTGKAIVKLAYAQVLTLGTLASLSWSSANSG